MKDEIKDKWISALECGEFEQGVGALNFENQEFCCLGVLCELAYREGVVSKERNGRLLQYGKEAEDAFLPKEVMEWAGIGGKSPRLDDHPVVELNDGMMSFKEIAILIKENL